jgi:uncharacterized membrane protein YgcG
MSRLIVLVCLAALFGSLSLVASASPQQGLSIVGFGFQEQEFPTRDQDLDRRVYDTANILSSEEETSLERELVRARSLGVEILVYTRVSADPIDESQAFADRLRTEWEVESAPGADDGLVYVATIQGADSLIAESAVQDLDPSIVASTGTNTLPIRQLDQDGFQNVVDNEMNPALADGEFNLSILYGVRRVINHAEYSPPEPAALSPTQSRLNTASRILAAGLVQIAAIGYFLVPVITEKRLTLIPSTRSLGIYAMVVGVASVLVGLVSIAGRSTSGSLTALALLIWAGCAVPLLIGLLSRRRGLPKSIRVAHRPDRQVKTNPALGRRHA